VYSAPFCHIPSCTVASASTIFRWPFSNRSRRSSPDPPFLLGPPGTRSANDCRPASRNLFRQLNPDHGTPFRLIVPHWYGVASVKWLKHIDVLTEPYVGEFETGHYMYQWADRPPERVTVMRVRARITDPARGATIPAGTYTVRGKAWSGTGPITNVDVSLTGEGDWHPAQVEPPKGPYQWQDWSFAWEAAEHGRHSLRARATDAAGNTQPEVPPWNRLGYGNNAIEVAYVDVR
jgi:hypothetical protein